MTREADHQAVALQTKVYGGFEMDFSMASLKKPGVLSSHMMGNDDFGASTAFSGSERNIKSV